MCAVAPLSGPRLHDKIKTLSCLLQMQHNVQQLDALGIQSLQHFLQRDLSTKTSCLHHSFRRGKIRAEKHDLVRVFQHSSMIVWGPPACERGVLKLCGTRSLFCKVFATSRTTGGPQTTHLLLPFCILSCLLELICHQISINILVDGLQRDCCAFAEAERGWGQAASLSVSSMLAILLAWGSNSSFC